MSQNPSSLKFRIIIVSLISCTLFTVYGQDLEEIDLPNQQRSRVIDDASSIEEPILPDAVTSSTITNQTGQRDPDTYRRDSYIYAMLRQTYQHKITTSPWSRYLKPEGWRDNVIKWRNWSQLRSYITGNDQDILILRGPENDVAQIPAEQNIDIPAPTITPPTLTSSSEPEQEVTPQEEEAPTEESTEITVVHTAPWLKEIEVIETPEDANEVEQIVEIDVADAEVDEEIPISTESNLVEEIVEAPAVAPPVVITQETEQVVRQEPVVQPVVPKPEVTRPVQPQTFTTSGIAPTAFATQRGNLSYPVRGRITDGFGQRENAEVRGLSPTNYGIDMLCPAGSSVKAVHSGTVLLARRQSPYDIIVTIKHGDYTSAYYYLISASVQQGDYVQAGQPIGSLRTSVEEADFHFEIWHNQERLNPEVWLKR